MPFWVYLIGAVCQNTDEPAINAVSGYNLQAQTTLTGQQLEPL